MNHLSHRSLSPKMQGAAALAAGALLLTRPQAAARGFAEGLALCGGSLLPALFPLFVVCALAAPLAPLLGRPLRPLARMCGVRDDAAPAVLVLGALGGYAVCAAQIARLRGQNRLTRRDAAVLLLLGCCSGPGFVVGCVGGQLLGSVRLGAALYALQLAANGLAAACLAPFLPPQTPLPPRTANGNDAPPTLPAAIESAVYSSLTVCGCVLFCRTLGAAAGEGQPAAVRTALSAGLELTSGCADFAARGSVWGVCLCLSVLGVSVFAQLAALLRGTAPLGLLAASRALHTLFLQGLARLCLPLVPGAAQAFSTLAPRVVVQSRSAPDTALAVFFFLCAALYRLYKCGQNFYNVYNRSGKRGHTV